MPTVTSSDGTRIAYETLGSGPPLILVDGALCYRASGPARPLAEQLQDRFTVYIYDRRGRGESGNTLPYAVEREVEDLEALIEAAGGEAMLYGISSGGVLALEAANRSDGVTRLFVYEAPLIVDGSRVMAPGYAEKMEALLAAGRHGAALRHFMRTAVGLPGFMVFIMQFMPMWRTLKAVAPTLAYDTALTAPLQQSRPLPPGRWSDVRAPAKIVGGTKSESWMRNAQKAIAAILPDARHAELEGENHMVKPEKIAPLIKEFFAA
jgi:pimeloyl-ACP methyl ester carboxylesterase